MNRRGDQLVFFFAYLAFLEHYLWRIVRILARQIDTEEARNGQ